eukprot:COSAG06_NODE_1932_length_8039_cov_5.660327_1_plen_323_part_00
MILPRPARDKHRKNSKKSAIFLQYRYVKADTRELQSGLHGAWLTPATYAQTHTADGFTKLSCGFLPGQLGWSNATGTAAVRQSAPAASWYPRDETAAAAEPPRSWAWTGDLEFLPWVPTEGHTNSTLPPQSAGSAGSAGAPFPGCSRHPDCLTCRLAGCGWCLEEGSCQYDLESSCGSGPPENHVGAAVGTAHCPAPDESATDMERRLAQERSSILAFERATSSADASISSKVDSPSLAIGSSSQQPAAAAVAAAAAAAPSSCVDSLGSDRLDKTTSPPAGERGGLLTCQGIFKSGDAGLDDCRCDVSTLVRKRRFCAMITT